MSRTRLSRAKKLEHLADALTPFWRSGVRLVSTRELRARGLPIGAEVLNRLGRELLDEGGAQVELDGVEVSVGYAWGQWRMSAITPG